MELLTSEDRKKAGAKERNKRWRAKKLLKDPDHFKKAARAWRSSRPEYYTNRHAEAPHKKREYGRAYYSRHPEKMMLKGARQRAIKKGVPFDLTAADIVIPEKCPVLGIDLYRGSLRKRDNSPSLDRIIPHLGYVPGNIAVISERANRIKNDATKEEIALLYRWLLKHETIH